MDFDGFLLLSAVGVHLNKIQQIGYTVNVNAKRGYGKGSLIIVDEKLLVLSDRGKLAMIEATPKAFKELAQAKVLEGKSWTSPTFADGKIYLRNQKEMACYDLTK